MEQSIKEFIKKLNESIENEDYNWYVEAIDWLFKKGKLEILSEKDDKEGQLLTEFFLNQYRFNFNKVLANGQIEIAEKLAKYYLEYDNRIGLPSELPYELIDIVLMGKGDTKGVLLNLLYSIIRKLRDYPDVEEEVRVDLSEVLERSHRLFQYISKLERDNERGNKNLNVYEEYMRTLPRKKQRSKSIKPYKDTIKERIERTERKLRNTIDNELKEHYGSGYWDKLEVIPLDVREEVEIKIEKEVKKYPFKDYKLPRAKLDFTNGGDYDKIIGKKNNWSIFQKIFVEKDELSRNLMDFNGIRNESLHHRPRDQIVTFRGRAAIMWLDSTLKAHKKN